MAVKFTAIQGLPDTQVNGTSSSDTLSVTADYTFAQTDSYVSILTHNTPSQAVIFKSALTVLSSCIFMMVWLACLAQIMVSLQLIPRQMALLRSPTSSL